jgi:hypothetical protein
MVSVRHGTKREPELNHWRWQLNVCLDEALRADTARLLEVATLRGAAAHRDEALGALMLAHLMKRTHQTYPEAEHFREVVVTWIRAHRDELVYGPTLHTLCYNYNWRGITGQTLANVEKPAKWPGRGWERLAAEAYFHTHRVLFASDALAQPPSNPASLAEDIAFIRRHTDVAIRFHWVDIAAEFALSLSVCGDRGAEFQGLVDALACWQRPEGDWLGPDTADLRRARHAVMVATLAMLEETSPDHTGSLEVTV